MHNCVYKERIGNRLLLTDTYSSAHALFDSSADSELRFQINRQRGVGILGGNIVSNSRSESSGTSARVKKNGVYGFSSIAECSNDAAAATVRAATENALFLSSRAGHPAPKHSPLERGSFTLDTNISDPEQKIYIDYASELDQYIARKYPNLASRYVAVRSDSIEKILKVSNGCDAHTVMPRSYVVLALTANTSDGAPVELYEPFGGYGTFDINFSSPDEMFEKVDSLYERLTKKSEGVYAEAGLKTCILGGMMSGMLAHEAVGHTVEADLVLSGSVALHSLGKAVASPLVSMVDFASEAFGKPTPLPVYVDDEGVVCEDAVLIKDGILTGYMNSRDSAEEFGVKPQGNARAFSFSDEPLIRMRNTAILPGSSKLSDMISSIDDGYYLVSSGNGQADTTGEFMFGVTEGYVIKNGVIKEALRDTTVSGVAFDMLKTVDMLSDSVVWVSSGMCGKKQPMPVGMGGPDVRCKITVGGR